MQRKEFDENIDIVESSIAHILDLAVEYVDIHVKVFNRRLLQNSLQIEAIVLTISEEDTLATLVDSGFIEDVQESMSQQGLDVEMSSIDVKYVKQLNGLSSAAHNSIETNNDEVKEDEDTEKTSQFRYLLIILAAAVGLLLGFIIFQSLKSRFEGKQQNALGKDEMEPGCRTELPDSPSASSMYLFQ